MCNDGKFSEFTEGPSVAWVGEKSYKLASTMNTRHSFPRKICPFTKSPIPPVSNYTGGVNRLIRDFAWLEVEHPEPMVVDGKGELRVTSMKRVIDVI